ncbi:MAG: ROK family protein [Capsulimonadales bacterium]|nr:ROK family protein [Capsulimonadales bacterium]
MEKVVLGLDLGGTKSAAVLASADGVILARQSAPTPVGADASGLVDFLTELAVAVRSGYAGNVVGVGVSAGAPADAGRGLVFDAPNLPGWGSEGYPLAQALSSRLDGLPVALENDADATALAEFRFGAGRGARNLVFMTVGTGIGGGFILNGQLHRGKCGAGGEVGHIAVVPDGRPCKCGLRGCAEAYASGPSLTRIALEFGFVGEPTGPAVIAAARNGDPPARRAVEQAGEMLGRAIATLAMLLNPERVILGTLAVHAGDLLLPIVSETVRVRAWSRVADGLEIVPAALGDRAQDLAALSAFLERFSM